MSDLSSFKFQKYWAVGIAVVGILLIFRSVINPYGFLPAGMVAGLLFAIFAYLIYSRATVGKSAKVVYLAVGILVIAMLTTIYIYAGIASKMH